VEIIRAIVTKRFGKERIKKINAFGPYEDEDLNVKVIVEGIESQKEISKVAQEILHKLWDLGLDVPFGISKV